MARKAEHMQNTAIVTFATSAHGEPSPRLRVEYRDATGELLQIRSYRLTQDSFRLNDDLLGWTQDGILPKERNS